MAQSVREMVSDSRRFFDWWNTLGFVLLLLLILTQVAGPVWSIQIGISTQEGILILTGVYAFTAFNHMREARWSRGQSDRMALRPHFVDELDGSGLTLCNFGDGAALDLRLRVVHRSSDGIEDFDVISEDDTVNLKEGDHYPISKSGLSGLEDPDSEVYEDPNGTLEFYYTWESTNGRQYPRGMNRPAEMPMDEVVDVTESPRTVRVSEVRERLT